MTNKVQTALKEIFAPSDVVIQNASGVWTSAQIKTTQAALAKWLSGDIHAPFVQRGLHLIGVNGATLRTSSDGEDGNLFIAAVLLEVLVSEPTSSD